MLLLFGALTKLLGEPHVAAAFAREGISASLMTGIGALTTGYLGGATAINLRAGDPPFESLFRVLSGVLVWLPVYSRDASFAESFARRS